MVRSFVPFEALWEMAIDVPYSFLVRDKEMAWSCGQLALDKNSQVIGPNDIREQSRVICDYIGEILDRGSVSTHSVTKLLLYYVHTGEPDRKAMLEIFRDRFGNNVLLVPICVPHYYYEGVLLEVDVFCDGPGRSYYSENQNGIAIDAVSTETHLWVSLEAKAKNARQVLVELASFLSDHNIKPEKLLSEHWFVPSDDMDEFASVAESIWPPIDILIDSGPEVGSINGHLVFAKNELKRQEKFIDVENKICLLLRQGESMTWLQARSLNENLGLVAQTDEIMKGIAIKMPGLGLNFSDVVKSTTHYAGGSSAAELHDNMQVRNAYYQKPGPSSTGLPVFGFSDNNSRIVIDLTFRK